MRETRPGAKPKRELGRIRFGEPLARFGDEQSRRDGYRLERGYRWEMEEFFRDPLMSLFCDKYGTVRNVVLSWTRNDEIVRQWPEGQQPPAWLRGTPDYRLNGLPDVSLVELKVKSELFRKTKFGARGGYPGYTTESHYIDPYVVDQLEAHCANRSVATEAVLVVFAFNPRAAKDYENKVVESSRWQFHVIRFSVILSKVRAQAYQKIRETGYGQPSYLVPLSDVEILAR